MNTKSIEVLGFESVRRSMISHARSAEGIRRLKTLPFLFDRELLQLRQSTIAELVELLALNSETPIHAFPRIDILLEEIEDPTYSVEGPLLVDLATYIESAIQLYRFLSTPNTEGEGFALAQALVPEPISDELITLGEEIRRTLDESGAVHESHPALVALYRTIDAHRKKRGQYCRSFIADHSDIVQADQEALRDGRLVIPIKREDRASVKGFVSGHSGSGQTLFVEPFALVELNNAVVMAQNQIQVEIAKILSALGAAVRKTLATILVLQNQVAEATALLAIASWIKQMGATSTNLSVEHLVLKRARHPLLGEKAIPISLSLDPKVSAVVFSGPNAGGKTVTIKTVGLFGLLNQYCGHVPAEAGSSLPLFDAILCDIGDEQSIDDALSTFSGHMHQIAKILGEATPASLILLDELGSGTDPVEGSALAQSILEYIHSRARLTLVTSHHTHLKQFAYAKEEIINASMAFDTRSLEPTFEVIVGVPGESHGLDMARQMGLPSEVITNTEGLLGGEQMHLSSLIASLEEQRALLQQEERAQQRRKQLLQEEVRKVHLRELRLKQAQAQLKGEQLSSLKRFTDSKRKELESLVATLRRSKVADTQKPIVPGAMQELEERIAEEEAALSTLNEEIAAALPKPTIHIYRVGESVYCGTAKREGKILEVLKGDQYLVAIDAMRMVLHAKDLHPSRTQRTEPSIHFDTSGSRPSSTLDVRGLTLAEALERVTLHLEGALVHGMDQFAVIHGFGDGILSRGIADYLKTQRNVKDFRFALPEDGGMGKTYIIL